MVTETLEKSNNVARAINKNIKEKEEFDFMKVLGTPPRYIRILVDNDAALEFLTPNNDWQTWPEGLSANVATEIEKEEWIAIRIVPTADPTSLKMYVSGWKPFS